MTIESVIGIVSGLITIILAIPILRNYLKPQSLNELMKGIVDKNLSSKKHQEKLRKMNKKLRLLGLHINEEYIQNFVLNDRKMEDVFKDICVNNDIEPTEEICKKFLGYDSKKAREFYNSKGKNDKTTEEMIVPAVQSQSPKSSKNNNEQIVFMSELLISKHPETCNNLITILEKHNVKYSFIKGTKDIWCRDYMPVQLESGKFIQFKYDPSYLKGEEWDSIRSNAGEIREKNDWLEKLNIEESDINLDGGNVLICEGLAIISDRIFEENGIVKKGNSNYESEKESLINDLSKQLECEIIIIPALRSKEEDMTGHADGMVRFVNRKTLIGNERRPNEYSYMKEGLQKAIDKFNLAYIDIPYFEDKDREHPVSAVGIYVNYLEINDLIIMPVFGREKEDARAKEIIQKAFPNKQIETINYNDVAKEGGLLNCTTWVMNG